jgi:gluconokinase
MTAFVLMGVSGAGKSTVGTRVARELGLPFVEGDEYHPAANIAKMSAGIPLTDADRGPWIEAVAKALNARSEPNVVVACSALSANVRSCLRQHVNAPVEFVFLTAGPSVIQQRLESRPKHYMKAGMLGSQFAALEVPSDAKHVDVGRPLEIVTNDVVDYIRLRLHA